MTRPPINQHPNPAGLDTYKQQRLAGDISRIHTALVVHQPIRTIPEQTFINEILPYYCGEATNLELPKLVAAAAGGPFLEFDVVNDAGEVLFRAPALLERSMFDFKSSMQGPSIENIFLTAQMLSNRSPREAERFVENNLTNKGLSKNAKEIFAKVMERRLEIMARYGKGPQGNKGVSTSGSNNGSTTRPELDYDDDTLL